jgi:hypothetical protein
MDGSRDEPGRLQRGELKRVTRRASAPRSSCRVADRWGTSPGREDRSASAPAPSMTRAGRPGLFDRSAAVLTATKRAFRKQILEGEAMHGAPVVVGSCTLGGCSLTRIRRGSWSFDSVAPSRSEYVANRTSTRRLHSARATCITAGPESRGTEMRKPNSVVMIVAAAIPVLFRHGFGNQVPFGFFSACAPDIHPCPGPERPPAGGAVSRTPVSGRLQKIFPVKRH